METEPIRGGGLGLGIILTSSDGITWTQRISGTSYEVSYGVTYGNGLFVTVGRVMESILTSSDGITWTQRISGTIRHISEE